ncbi:hypothetical protein D3C81_1468220 [compost metagenome]
MRVDFCLQRFQHGVFLDNFHLVPLINQLIGPLYHLVEPPGQIGDLIASLHFCLSIKRSFTEPAHLIGKLLERQSNGIGSKYNQYDSKE